MSAGDDAYRMTANGRNVDAARNRIRIPRPADYDARLSGQGSESAASVGDFG
jgi:hypothetical protein